MLAVREFCYAPQDTWAFNLLKTPGEAKLRELVAEVKAMAADF